MEGRRKGEKDAGWKGSMQESEGGWRKEDEEEERVRARGRREKRILEEKEDERERGEGINKGIGKYERGKRNKRRGGRERE